MRNFVSALKFILLFIGSTSFITACTSSGVIKTGPDTYSISTHYDFSSTGAKIMAYTEAHEYCSEMGKELLTISTNQRSQRVAGIPTSNFDLGFRCLDKDDPELKYPNLKPVPDTLIEVK